MPDKTKLMNAVALGFIDDDGIADAIPALNRFVEACIRKGEAIGYVPGLAANKRGYRFRSVSAWRQPHRGLFIPPGFMLLGDGPEKTRFFQDPATFDGTPPKWPAFGFIFYSSGSILQGLGFDGQRQLIQDGAQTRFASCFVQSAEPACKGAVFRDLLMTNNIGGLTESFCISTSLQEDGALFERVRCIDNNGSGISCNGDMVKEHEAPGTGLAHHIRVIDCEGSGNVWQGITFYGCRDTLLQNFKATRNGSNRNYAGNGANFEWTYQMRIAGGTFSGNVGGGIGGYGDNDGICIDDVDCHDNNSVRSSRLGEISFAVGPWWDQRHGTLVGLARGFKILGGQIRPGRDAEGNPLAHLNVDAKGKQMTYPVAGPPSVVKIEARGVKDLTARDEWRLTPSTDPSGFRVS